MIIFSITCSFWSISCSCCGVLGVWPNSSEYNTAPLRSLCYIRASVVTGSVSRRPSVVPFDKIRAEMPLKESQSELTG